MPPRDETQEWALWSIAESLASHSSRSRESERVAPLVDAAKGYLVHDLHSPSSLDTLSAHVGVTRDKLVRAFVTETGVPPYAWQLQMRLIEGQRRLRSGCTVADVAAYARTPGQESRRT